MKRFSRVLSSCALVLGSGASLANVADAQMVNGRWQLPAKSASTGRQGVIVQGPPARQPVLVPNPTAPTPGNISYPQPVQPVQFTLVPAILMSDGSIYANFGFGYEPVVRSCVSNVVIVPGQAQRIGSNGASIPNHGAAQPSATQPQAVRLSVPAQTACFTRDGFGRVFVYRRS